MSTYKEAHRCATSYVNSPELYQILCRRIIEKKWFPSVNRAGFWTERPDSNWFLEQWIPFDISNMSTENNTDNINMGYLDGVKKLVLGSDSQAEYRSVMLRVESPAMIPGNYNATGVHGNYNAAEWQFYKCKFIYDGSVEYDRLDAVRYPVTIHCLGNNEDVIGQFITPDDFERTGYYGES